MILMAVEQFVVGQGKYATEVRLRNVRICSVL